MILWENIYQVTLKFGALPFSLCIVHFIPNILFIMQTSNTQCNKKWSKEIHSNYRYSVRMDFDNVLVALCLNINTITNINYQKKRA